MTDLKKLRELCLAATPGPWTYEELENDPADACGRGEIHQIDVKGWALDLEFIAAFNPQTILKLLDEVERYREALEWYAAWDWTDKYVQAIPKRAQAALASESVKENP